MLSLFKNYYCLCSFSLVNCSKGCILIAKKGENMSFSLPILDVENFIAERQETRTLSWESNFEKNHKTFAENIACGIAKQVIEELGNTIKDPYNQPIGSKNKFVSNVSLEIIKSRTAKKIINLTEGSEELPPFNEWLAKFSTEQKQSDQHYFEENLRGVDREYFEELMAIVGRLADKKLNQIFSEFTSNSEHKDLQFKIEWYRKSDQQFSNPSDFRDNCLRIELWFNEKIISKQAEKSSAVIEQHRVRQKELQNIRIGNNILVAMVVVIIGLMILRSGIIEISLPPSNQ